MSVVMKKLTKEQIKDYKWVLNNLDSIDWNETDGDEPYIICDGWLHGVLNYEKSELENDLKTIIKNEQVKEIQGQIALDLVVDYCKELEL